MSIFASSCQFLPGRKLTWPLGGRRFHTEGSPISQNDFPKISQKKRLFPTKKFPFPGHFTAIFSKFSRFAPKTSYFFHQKWTQNFLHNFAHKMWTFSYKNYNQICSYNLHQKFLSFAGEKMGKYNEFWDILVEKS